MRNIKLKSSDEKAKKLYIKYDSKTKKYIVKDSTTNNSLYKPSENYVKVSVSESLEFDVVRNGKTDKQTVKSVVSTHSNISDPKGDEGSINLSTLTFNKKGVCTKITETIQILYLNSFFEEKLFYNNRKQNITKILQKY